MFSIVFSIVLLLFGLIQCQTDKYNIIISEIMYANEPPSTDTTLFMNAYEFIEFKNLQTTDIDMSGW
jgi:hypothetical protein